jgi:hypothetical protein
MFGVVEEGRRSVWLEFLMERERERERERI